MNLTYDDRADSDFTFSARQKLICFSESKEVANERVHIEYGGSRL